MSAAEFIDVLIEAKIIARHSAEGHPFSDVLLTEGTRHFLTRYWYPLSDTPHARAAEVQAFLDRRRRFP
jgi:hypothetical protein